MCYLRWEKWRYMCAVYPGSDKSSCLDGRETTGRNRRPEFLEEVTTGHSYNEHAQATGEFLRLDGGKHSSGDSWILTCLVVQKYLQTGKRKRTFRD